MSKSKIPVRDLTPMFHQIPSMDKEGHRSRKDKTTFSANFGASDRSRSLERHQRSNDKIKDLRNLVSFPKEKLFSLGYASWFIPGAHRFLQKFLLLTQFLPPFVLVVPCAIRETQKQINIKDNQIHELVGKVTKLFEENEKLRHDKTVLVENYNSLYEKLDKVSVKGHDMKADSRVNAAESLQTENTEMKNDLKMMKILVFRLNKHIELYQNLLDEREMRFDHPKKHQDENEIASSWEIKSHLLAPLLNSYEERIKEKNDIIKNYEMELNQVSVKVKKILDENEKLQEMFDNLNKNSEVWMMEKQRLTSQCEILKNKASIHCKRADLAKEKLVEILKAYEQKVQSQALDIERLQEAYNRSKGEITTLKNFQKNPEAVAESIKDCQKWVFEFCLLSS